jgi:hypothetical protein
MAPAPSPEVIDAALRKADEHEWWRLASPQFDGGSFPKWAVPSRTTPGVYYTVWRPSQARARLPWWDALECNCPTARIHSRRVCWHKAAVYRRWERWRKVEAFAPNDDGTVTYVRTPNGHHPKVAEWPARQLHPDGG